MVIAIGYHTQKHLANKFENRKQNRIPQTGLYLSNSNQKKAQTWSKMVTGGGDSSVIRLQDR